MLCPRCHLNPLPEGRHLPLRDGNGVPLCDACFELEERVQGVVSRIRTMTAAALAQAIEARRQAALAVVELTRAQIASRVEARILTFRKRREATS